MSRPVKLNGKHSVIFVDKFTLSRWTNINPKIHPSSVYTFVSTVWRLTQYPHLLPEIFFFPHPLNISSKIVRSTFISHSVYRAGKDRANIFQAWKSSDLISQTKIVYPNGVVNAFEITEWIWFEVGEFDRFRFFPSTFSISVGGGKLYKYCNTGNSFRIIHSRHSIYIEPILDKWQRDVPSRKKVAFGSCASETNKLDKHLIEEEIEALLCLSFALSMVYKKPCIVCHSMRNMPNDLFKWNINNTKNTIYQSGCVCAQEGKKSDASRKRHSNNGGEIKNPLDKHEIHKSTQIRSCKKSIYDTGKVNGKNFSYYIGRRKDKCLSIEHEFIESMYCRYWNLHFIRLIPLNNQHESTRRKTNEFYVYQNGTLHSSFVSCMASNWFFVGFVLERPLFVIISFAAISISVWIKWQGLPIRTFSKCMHAITNTNNPMVDRDKERVPVPGSSRKKIPT